MPRQGDRWSNRIGPAGGTDPRGGHLGNYQRSRPGPSRRLAKTPHILQRGCQRIAQGRIRSYIFSVKISKKAEYGLRALVAIAKRPRAKPVSIQELSDGEGIPLKFLEQILLALKNAGVLVSKRGVGGGYRLAKEASQITIGEVLETMDGPLRPLVDAPTSSGLARCLASLEELAEEFLNGHSIADVVAMEQAPRRDGIRDLSRRVRLPIVEC